MYKIDWSKVPCSHLTGESPPQDYVSILPGGERYCSACNRTSSVPTTQALEFLAAPDKITPEQWEEAQEQTELREAEKQYDE